MRSAPLPTPSAIRWSCTCAQSHCLSSLSAAVVLDLAGGARLAQAEQVYSQTVFFRDSLNDSRHFRPALALRAGQASA